MTRDDLKYYYSKIHRNFMTPHVLKTQYLHAQNIVIELSEGKGITNNQIFGVTLLKFDDSGKLKLFHPNLSKMVYDQHEAESYFVHLSKTDWSTYV